MSIPIPNGDIRSEWELDCNCNCEAIFGSLVMCCTSASASAWAACVWLRQNVNQLFIVHIYFWPNWNRRVILAHIFCCCCWCVALEHVTSIGGTCFMFKYTQITSSKINKRLPRLFVRSFFSVSRSLSSCLFYNLH